MTFFTKTFTHPDGVIAEKLTLTIELNVPTLRVNGSLYSVADEGQMETIIRNAVKNWEAKLRVERQNITKQATLEESLRRLGFVEE